MLGRVFAVWNAAETAPPAEPNAANSIAVLMKPRTRETIVPEAINTLARKSEPLRAWLSLIPDPLHVTRMSSAWPGDARLSRMLRWTVER